MSTTSRVRALVMGLAVACATVGGVSGQVSPAQAISDSGSTGVTVQVGLSITLTDLTPSFTLTGNPGDQVPANGAVSMRVTTNSPNGYTVTVQPAAATLIEANGGTDTFSVGSLQVRGPALLNFTSLAFGTALTVAGKDGPSDPAGDVITNDYQVTIPFVRPGTYTGTLNYVASTNT